MGLNSLLMILVLIRSISLGVQLAWSVKSRGDEKCSVVYDRDCCDINAIRKRIGRISYSEEEDEKNS